MADIFDQLASSQPPATQTAATGDIFDQLSGDQQEPAFTPTTPSAVTPDNHIQRSSDYINSLEAEGRATSALAKQAIVDQFRTAAGLDPLLGKDFHKEALKKRNDDNPIFAFAAGVNETLGGTGTSLLGTVAPETAARLQAGVESRTGEASGAAAGAGRLLAGGAVAAAALPTGGAGLATVFGAQGFGGTRVDVANRRAAGQEISSIEEFTSATLVGGIEGLSGFVSAGVAQRLGPAFQALGPSTRAAVAQGGGKAAVASLIPKLTPILKGAGVEAAEEAAAQLATNMVRRLGIDPEQGLTSGVVAAGAGGAILSPFLGGVAGKIQSSPSAGSDQQRLASALIKNPTLGKNVSQKEQIKQLQTALAEERRAARTDPLTGIGNLQQETEEIQRITAEADETGEPIAFVETDLANFKVVNDKLGHEVGDRILVAEAEAIREALREQTEERPGDFAGHVNRVGGDEFPVKLRNIDDKAKAGVVMERAQAIFDQKLDEIIGEDLPRQAYPFIAWGADIRTTNDPRTPAEIKVAAEANVIPNKNQRKAERGVPETRDGLTAFVDEWSTARAAKLRGEQDVSTFTPAQVVDAMRATGDPLADTAGTLLANEEHVLVDLPIDRLPSAFLADAEIDQDKLADTREKTAAGGVMPPIVTTPIGSGALDVVDGRHRLKVAAENGNLAVPAFVPRTVAESMGLAPTASRDVVTSQNDPSLNPNQDVREQAQAYVEQAGLPPIKQTPYRKVDEARAKKIARLFEQMEHNPTDPKVRASYNALKQETLAQYEFLVDSGVVFEPWPNPQSQPYANSREMHADVKQGHLWFFTGGDHPADHPMMEPSGINSAGRDLSYNDLFRAAHDYFGHAKEGSGFGPRGEEHAWQEHAQMFSDAARPAMTSETRGQNSWVNFGPHGEANRADPENTIYAEQKAGLLPPWVSDPTGRDPRSVPPKTTAAKKAKTTVDREALGLTRLEGADLKTWQEALDESRSEKIPDRALRIAAQVETKARALSDTETAGLVIKAAALKNEHARIMDEIGRASDSAVIASKSEEAYRVEQEFDLLTKALRTSGTEKGRALNAQKLTIDQDFSLVATLARAKAAKGDKLTQAERSSIEDLVAELKAMEARLKKMPPGKEADALSLDRDILQRRIRTRIDRLRPRSVWERWVVEPFNAARAIMTSFDFSAVLRQGGFIAVGHPVRAAKAIRPMLRAFASEQGAQREFQKLERRFNADNYHRTGLFLAPPDGSVSLKAKEEAYMSRWAEKIPIVRNSERAYLTFLNRLRADSFDTMVAGMAKNGTPTLREGRAIANFINVATGRGTLGKLEGAAVTLNTFFFAPRYVSSRFQILAGQPFYGGNARTRKMIAGEYGRYLAGLLVFYSLLAAWNDDDDESNTTNGIPAVDAKASRGVKVQWDPRSSDFGKVKIGNTRLDPLSGLSQTTVVLSRITTGKTKSSTSGEVSPIRGEEVQFGRSTTAGVIGRFMRSKLAPAFGTALDLAAGENVVGEPVTPGVAAANLVTPLALREVWDAVTEHGVPKGTALGAAAILGVGMQTYTRTRTRETARKEALEWARLGDLTSARIVVDRWNAEREEGQKPLSVRGLSTTLRNQRRKARKAGQ